MPAAASRCRSASAGVPTAIPIGAPASNSSVTAPQPAASSRCCRIVFHAGSPAQRQLFRTDFRFAPSPRRASLAVPPIHEGETTENAEFTNLGDTGKEAKLDAGILGFYYAIETLKKAAQRFIQLLVTQRVHNRLPAWKLAGSCRNGEDGRGSSSLPYVPSYKQGPSCPHRRNRLCGFFRSLVYQIEYNAADGDIISQVRKSLNGTTKGKSKVEKQEF